MSINPIEIKGNWDKGFVLDKHILSSVCVGEDVYGHPRFDNTYTELGNLIFQLKNRNAYDNVNKILEIIKPFLDDFAELKEVDIVLSVPPSKERCFQPARELACAIAEYLKVYYVDGVLEKISPEQSKNMDKDAKNLKGCIIKKQNAKKEHKILLIDDLYSTGATITECVEVLKTDPLLTKVYVVVMTKTR